MDQPKYDIAASPKLMIIDGPHPLQHEGRLRNTGTKFSSGKKVGDVYTTRASRQRQTMLPSDHWCMYAFKVYIPEDNVWYLGLQFQSGYRCYYPATASPQEENPYFHAIMNAESGSYWVWDNLKDKPLGAGYVKF